MIFGAVLMVGGALLVSTTIAEKEKRKIEILEALCRLITYIKQNIETFGTPIDDIIAGYRCEILEGYGFKDAIRLRGEREIPYQLIELISEEAQSVI